MRHRRQILITPKGVNPRRLAAARRRQNRVRERWALFPEYWPSKTPEEEISEVDRLAWEAQIKSRASRAALWHQARERLRLRQDRSRILDFWQTCGYPGDPDVLMRVMDKEDREPGWIASRFAAVEKAAMIGQIMSGFLQETQADAPDEAASPANYRERFFYRLGRAAARARELRPDLFPGRPTEKMLVAA